jgi:hypothetical protein
MIRCFVLDIGRRWGKTFLVALIRVEDCLRRSNAIITYATAFQSDIVELIQPMLEDLFEDCPDDVRPIYNRGRKTWLFKNGSRLKLVGIDKNPRGMRGKASDGFNVTEAGHVRNLAQTIGTVIYQQFQRRPWATLILESNAPEDPEHDFDRIFIPDAEKRGAYVFETIDDNEAISEQEKEEFVEASITAVGKEDTERELWGKRQRTQKRMIVAEFDAPNEKRPFTRHVVESVPPPRYARAFTFMDPGETDPLALVFAYWDFERAKLVVQHSYAESNMRTPAAAKYITSAEQNLWATPRKHGPEELNERVRHTTYHHSKGWKFQAPDEALTYWDGTMFKPNPCARVSDIDAKMTGDLAGVYDVPFDPAEKDNAEAAQGALRQAFADDRIEILAEGNDPLITQLARGIWRFDANGRRVEWARSKALGHCDCIAALVYGWRKVQHYRYLNPYPPAVTDLKASGVATLPWHKDADRSPQDGQQKLRQVLRPQRRYR